MPAIARLAGKIKDSRWKLALVNTSEDDDAVFSFLGAVAPNLNTLMDRDGQATEHWQPRGLPATFLVDPHGRIRYMALGGRPWDTPTYLQFLERLAAAH